ncbi:MAG TPA: hypothetical protein VGQ09_01760 [Chitinophagaceae bacterium]|jgi:hypothetical protein|nr:hypothetical protein [Chitinophagaceae bacterium]
MDFLFHTIVQLRGKRIDYNVYELLPGKYKAELLSNARENFKPAKKIVFWKEKERWKAESFKNQDIVEILGKDIELYKNK